MNRATPIIFSWAGLMMLLSGCRTTDPIPTYPPMSAAESFDRMQARSAQVQDVSGEGEITLVNGEGNAVQFEAAFALAPPNRARIRAWKVGQAVLDLTVTEEGAWLFLPRKDDRADQLRAVAGDASRALHEWLALLSNRPDAGAKTVEADQQEFVVTRNTDDGRTIIASIDRPTLTPRQYAVRDRAGQARFTLSLEQYRVAGNTVWPTKVQATSPSGKFVIELRDVEINQAPSSAFEHPARAERLP